MPGTTFLTSLEDQDSDVTLALQGLLHHKEKDTAAPFDHADRNYVVDGIRVVLSFRLHQQEDHFEQLATCV